MSKTWRKPKHGVKYFLGIHPEVFKAQMRHWRTCHRANFLHLAFFPFLISAATHEPSKWSVRSHELLLCLQALLDARTASPLYRPTNQFQRLTSNEPASKLLKYPITPTHWVVSSISAVQSDVRCLRVDIRSGEIPLKFRSSPHCCCQHGLASPGHSTIASGWRDDRVRQLGDISKFDQEQTEAGTDTSAAGPDDKTPKSYSVRQKGWGWGGVDFFRRRSVVRG